MWNPTLNAAVKSIDIPDRNWGIRRYKSTNCLCRSYIEKGDIQITSAKKRAVFDVWVVIIVAMMPWTLLRTRNNTYQ